MRTRRALAGAVLMVLAVGVVPAQAATKPAPPVVVATDGPVKLQVGDENEDLCLGIDAGLGSGEACDTAEVGEAVIGATAAGTRLLGAAVPAAAATIEVRRAGQLLAAGPTVAGEAYTGKRAGTVRFALVRLPKGASQDGLRVRALGAGGTLLAVIAPNGSESDLVLDRHRLLSGRSGAVRWSVVSQRASALRPSVVDLGHETVSQCVAVSVRSGRGGSSTQSCLGLAPQDDLTLFAGALAQASVEDMCTPVFRLLHGVVDASVRRVSVRLGDGTSALARSRPLGDGLHRVYALVIARTAAVRSVSLETSGAGTTVVHVAAAPLAVVCAAAGPGYSSSVIGGGIPLLVSAFPDLPPVTPVGPVTTIPGSPAMRVADGAGDTLCVAVGDHPFTALGCGVVSPLLGEVLGTYDDFANPHAFAIVVPAVVSTLRIAGPGGTGTRDIPTLPGTGYGGPYAGHVRFAAGSIADTRELGLIEYLDASGNVLHRESDTPTAEDFVPPMVSVPRRIAGRAGGPSLWQTSLRAGGVTAPCLALTRGPKPSVNGACQTARARQSVLLDSDCATHRLTVAVAAADGTHVFATTSGARAVPIALRRGAGLLTLSPGSGLKAVTFVRKGQRSRVRLDAPPGARQCGWSATPTGTFG